MYRYVNKIDIYVHCQAPTICFNGANRILFIALPIPTSKAVTKLHGAKIKASK